MAVSPLVLVDTIPMYDSITVCEGLFQPELYFLRRRYKHDRSLAKLKTTLFTVKSPMTQPTRGVLSLPVSLLFKPSYLCAGACLRLNVVNKPVSKNGTGRHSAAVHTVTILREHQISLARVPDPDNRVPESFLT